MNRSQRNVEPVLRIFHPLQFDNDDKASSELKKEMTEMKKMLKDMQQSATHSPFS